MKIRKPELQHSGGAGAVAETSPADQFIQHLKVLLLNEEPGNTSPADVRVYFENLAIAGFVKLMQEIIPAGSGLYI